MSPLRFGHLNYINAFPIYTALVNGAVNCPATLVPGNPAELNSLLSKGELDISLVSSFEYLRNQHLYEPMPGFCIAAEREVMSVTLYVKGGLGALNDQVIGLTKQSASSAQLVKVLAAHHWHVSPQYELLPNLADATSYQGFLLIGDQALQNPQYDGYEAIDLATAWYELTGLPMTFAIFAARKEVLQTRGDELLNLLSQMEKSLCWAQDHEEEIFHLAEQSSGLPRSTLEAYYPLLRYRLGPSECEGLKQFGRLSGYLPQCALKVGLET